MPEEKSADKPEEKIEENPERKFLHDISNRMAVAYGMLDVVIESGSQLNNVAAEQLKRLEKARDNLDRLKALIKERREHLLHKTDGKN